LQETPQYYYHCSFPGFGRLTVQSRPSNPEAVLYPGAQAGPEEILALAEEYRRAATSLLPQGRKGEPISRAPARLCAIHAIELYLNAFLLRSGETATRVRGLQHDLRARTDVCVGKGLILRSRTIAHLHQLTDGREYLVSRYGPEMSTSLSQINRLIATLEEVARKVAPPAS
jgi:hypothetical protein